MRSVGRAGTQVGLWLARIKVGFPCTTVFREILSHSYPKQTVFRFKILGDLLVKFYLQFLPQLFGWVQLMILISLYNLEKIIKRNLLLLAVEVVLGLTVPFPISKFTHSHFLHSYFPIDPVDLGIPEVWLMCLTIVFLLFSLITASLIFIATTAEDSGNSITREDIQQMVMC